MKAHVDLSTGKVERRPLTVEEEQEHAAAVAAADRVEVLLAEGHDRIANLEAKIAAAESLAEKADATAQEVAQAMKGAAPQSK